MCDAFFIKSIILLKKTHFIREEWIMNKFDSLKLELPNQYTGLVTCKSTIFRGRYYFSIHDVISFLFTHHSFN